MPTGTRYGRILGLQHAPRLIVSGFVGRLPTGMVSLALVLFVAQKTGSYAHSGLATGVMALGIGIGMPLQGRLIDRLGPSEVLSGAAVLQLAVWVAVVIVGEDHGPFALLLAACIVAGITTPALTPTVRMLWSRLTDEDPAALDMALGFESALIEAFYSLGPLLTALIVAVASAGVALLCVGALALVGTLALAVAPLTRGLGDGAGRDQPAPGERVHVLRSRAALTVVLAMLVMGAVFGSVELGAPAYAAHDGHRALAGVALAANAICSMAGGLAYGAHSWGLSRASRFWRFGVVHALLYIPLLFVASLPELVLFMALAGFAVAPLITCVYVLVEVSAPAGALTEAYSWTSAALFTGAALGAAIAGVLVHSVGVRAPFALSVVFAAVVAGVAFALSRTVLREAG